MPSYAVTPPIRVGLVGTGFAAKRRADALCSDHRSPLVAVAGSQLERTQAFCQPYQAEAMALWEELVQREDLDLVVISTINRDHGTIARAALQQGKHVVVEYPLSFDPMEADELVSLAATTGKLLHVEHIELLGGLHQALIGHLETIQPAFYARYVTISPKHPAPRRWSYNRQLFGFPLVGALSRISRFSDRFGEVTRISCQDRYWDTLDGEFYSACLCAAQLDFASGVMAEVVYGKGDVFWQRENRFEVHGENGHLILTPETGQLVRGETIEAIEIGSRRGLFAKDTTMAIDHLLEGKPLYNSNVASLYALKVADAARRSAQTGKTILRLDDSLLVEP